MSVPKENEMTEILKELEEVKKSFKDHREQVFERMQELGLIRDDRQKSDRERIGTSEDALCELSEELDARLADIEDALCELSDDTTEIGAAGETEVK